ncbi:MAG: hypothetical protein ABIF71_12450 [Planctomycetota bacterium]
MEPAPRFVDRATVIRMTVLVIWAVFLAVLLVSGGYRKYLHPSLGWLLAAGALGLATVAAALTARLRVAHIHTHECREEGHPCAYVHRLRFADIRPLLIFAVPLLIVLGNPLSGGLSATMAGGLAAAGTGAVTGDLGPDGRPRISGVPEYSIIEAANAPDRLPERVAVVGMVLKPAGVAAPAFRLVRFTISCCAADARPVVLDVQAGDIQGFNYEALPENTWVGVTGTVVTGPAGVTLKADAIQPVERPADEYLY